MVLLRVSTGPNFWHDAVLYSVEGTSTNDVNEFVDTRNVPVASVRTLMGLAKIQLKTSIEFKHEFFPFTFFNF
jgi:hypothetical protein